ncbi:MAG: hypothetical protein A2Y12_11925 [Planctomycetes bacterium GWF2_42_9]|nr:MAG: hypothetical protein A2Y12_11925 [Planctomycetes bacterium GWF2_42_9]HAL45057.1 hypothetical protein [Phycisphaerales bacterium]
MLQRIIRAALILIFAVEGFCEINPSQAQYFGAEDLQISGKSLISFQIEQGDHILVFDDGFKLSLGDNTFSSSKAVVWLNSTTSEHLAVEQTEYKLTVYMQDKVNVKQGKNAKMSGLETQNQVVEGAESLVAKFTVNGEVFVTADKRVTEDPTASELYRKGMIATGQTKIAPAPQIAQGMEPATDAQDEAPKLNVFDKVLGGKKTAAADANTSTSDENKTAAKREKKKIQRTGKKSWFAKKEAAEPNVIPPKPKPPVKINYPVNISSATEKPITYTNENLPDGTGIASVSNRFYLWQKQDENRTLELMGDSAVIFYSQKTNEPNTTSELLPNNSIKAIYIQGDVIMTEGTRTIRAAEAYYDFVKKQALIIKAEIVTYDPQRGIPVYVRADKIRQVAENKFAGENVTLTNSEFYVPQISATASKVFITDTTNVDQAAGKADTKSYDAIMENVKMKVNDKTVFWWPRMRSNSESSDLPLRRIQISNDNSFGTAIETEWYLARVLGLKEPKGVDSRLMIDQYSKRGIGAGADIEYERDTYFGNVNGYIINDRGDDDLGRRRKNIEPPDKMRGMFNFWHRHILPEHWQLTLETSYMSDENFLEAFHRDQYFEDHSKETSIHLKWLKDNKAFAVLGRWRINKWADQLEDLPSAQYHIKGESLWNDKLTLYSDSSLGRYRQLTGEDHDFKIKDEYYTFGSHRTEIDFPLQYKKGNIVPFVAGTYGYDDRSGFSRGVGTGGTGPNGEENVFIGEAGLRTSTQFWKQYNAHSKFWDINGIRHIVKPYANASVFAESSDFVEQRDTITLGVLQRWQTKRGLGEKMRIVDWMRLNLEYTKVSDPSSLRRADRSLWNNPFVPLSVMNAPTITNSDLGSRFRQFEEYGPQRDMVNADYIWRVTDTTAILSDIYWDVKDASVEQFDIGISKMVWPNLSLYVGDRYMRSVEIDGDRGSNALTFAATYKLTPRYTLAFAHQYDFKRNGLIATQVSIIRRYSRLYYALSYGVDESLDRSTISLTIWPEGIGELGMGSRSLFGLDSPAERNY